MEPTVFIVDDDLTVGDFVSAVVRTMGLRAESYTTPHELLASPEVSRAGCIILDDGCSGISGIQVMDKLSANGIRLPVIVITADPCVSCCVDTMRHGALDYLKKPCDPARLMESIRSAMKIDARRQTLDLHRKDVRALLEALTTREREVLTLVLQGKLSKQIARDLGISPKTVDVHRSRITQKLGLDSWAEVAVLVTPFLTAGPQQLEPQDIPSRSRSQSRCALGSRLQQT